MGNNSNKMDLDTLIIFGAGSYLAKQIVKKIKFKQIICISRSLKKNFYKDKKIKIFDNFSKNKNEIQKLIYKKKITALFLNNYTVDNLILKKNRTELTKELEENLINVFEDAKELSKLMIVNNFGRIIFVASSRGLSSDIGISGYSITKNGVIGLMRSFSKEFSRYNITSNCLSLGFFKSPLFLKIKPELQKKLLSRCDIKSLGDVESINNAIYFISKTRYLTGSNLFLDGGFR